MRALALLLVAYSAGAQTRLAPDQVRFSAGGTPPPANIVLESVQVSSTQAVLAYTAPNAAACQIIVSEGAAVGLPVHDLDPALFAGADADNRPGNISDGARRVAVIGRRRVAKAVDGRRYSLALQAATDHAYRITCGDKHLDGHFKTTTIPSGVTFADAFQIDSETPGRFMLPTHVQQRGATVIDPQTGALLKRLTLDADRGYAAGMILSYGAFVRNCSNSPVTAPDGASGFLCTVYDLNAWGKMFFIVPSTGEIRNLGKVMHPYPYVSDKKTVYFNDEGGNVFRQTYVGNFQHVDDVDYVAQFTDWQFYSAPMGPMVQRFDASFDPSLFFCVGTGTDAGGYAMINCSRRGQDSYGWIAAFYSGDGRPVDPNCADGDKCPRIVGAWNVTASPTGRWCTLHNVQLVPGYPLISVNYQWLKDQSGGLGTSSWIMHSVAPVPAGATTITVDHTPRPLNDDPYQQALKVGDLVAVGTDHHEIMRITSIAPGDAGQIHLTVARNVSGQARQIEPAEPLWMWCSGSDAMGYWQFLADPHGTDETNTKTLNDHYWGGGGHVDNGVLGRVSEDGTGWMAVPGNIIEHLNTPVTVKLEDSPTFAGVKGIGYGSTTSKHPSYHQGAGQTTQEQQRWFLDSTPFDGSNLISDDARVHLISGQLYAYYTAPGMGADLARHQLPTSASTGGEGLRDVSGPTSHIPDDGSGSYTYCVVDVHAGECRPGSQLGDVFINAPGVQFPRCSGGDGPQPWNKDLCLGNLDPYYQAVTQLMMTDSPATSTAQSRVLARLGGLKGGYYYSLAKTLPDGSWTLISLNDYDTGIPNIWMVRNPPFAAGDTTDRRNFLPRPITLAKPTDARITGAAIEFGYAEYGAADQFRCTTRQEPCLVAAATVDQAHPFRWQSEAVTPQPCAEGCTIALPLAPLHLAYYRARYTDAAGAVVGMGPVNVVIDGMSQ